MRGAAMTDVTVYPYCGEGAVDGQFEVCGPDQETLFILSFNPTSSQLRILLDVYCRGRMSGWADGRDDAREEIRAVLGIPELIAREGDARRTSIRELSERVEEVARTNERRIRFQCVGFVYLMEGSFSTGTEWKIGFSHNPVRRSVQIERDAEVPVRVICSIPALDMRALERSLHERFADKRTRGEWFKLDPEDVNYIRMLARVGS